MKARLFRGAYGHGLEGDDGTTYEFVPFPTVESYVKRRRALTERPQNSLTRSERKHFRDIAGSDPSRRAVSRRHSGRPAFLPYAPPRVDRESLLPILVT